MPSNLFVFRNRDPLTTTKWSRYLLLLVAAICVILYFYGSAVNKDYLAVLPTIGGLAFGLNTLINLAH